MKSNKFSTLLLVVLLSGCDAFIMNNSKITNNNSSDLLLTNSNFQSSSLSTTQNYLSSTKIENSTSSKIDDSFGDNSSSNDKEDSSSSSSIQDSSSSTIVYEEVLDTKGFEFTEVDDGYFVSGYNNDLKNICKIPTKYNEKKVYGIAKNAFKGNTVISELVIPYSIKVIEESAFEKSTNLEKITLKSQVNLRSKAFYKCFALKEIISLEGGFSNIGEYAFYNCSNLTTVDFTSFIELENIEAYAFYNCVKLKNTKMPSSLKEIGVKAFYHCVLFKSLSFSNDSELTTIREAAFENCTTLENVYLPYKLQILEKNPFGYCQKLKKIMTLSGPNGESGKYTAYNNNGSYTLLERETYNLVINPSGKSSLDGLKLSSKSKKIYPYAFRGCNHLANIEIPESIEEIGENAFFGVNGSTTINIPKANKFYSYDSQGFYNYDKTEYISYTKFGSSNVEECIIPETVEIIKDYAFFNAEYLTKLTLKNKNTIISNNALAGSKITEIYIEEDDTAYNVDEYIYNYNNSNSIDNYLNVEATSLNLLDSKYQYSIIGDYAFSNKTKLEYIILNENIKNFGDYVFHGTNANLIIYLDINKEDIKSNSEYWNDGREVYYKGEWELVNDIPTLKGE